MYSSLGSVKCAIKELKGNHFQNYLIAFQSKFRMKVYWKYSSSYTQTNQLITLTCFYYYKKKILFNNWWINTTKWWSSIHYTLVKHSSVVLFCWQHNLVFSFEFQIQIEQIFATKLSSTSLFIYTVAVFT